MDTIKDNKDAIAEAKTRETEAKAMSADIRKAAETGGELPALTAHKECLKTKQEADAALLERATAERKASEAEELALSKEKDLYTNALANHGKLPIKPKNQIHIKGGDDGLGSGATGKTSSTDKGFSADRSK